MDTTRGNRTFEDYEPTVEWIRAAEADSVKITVPGFKREEIRVLVDNHGHLRTRGERPVAGTRWSRFQKDFKLTDNCNVDGIRAKFESETLTITLPKKSPSPQVAATAPPVPEPRRPAAAPPQKPPPAIPEPARPAPPTVPPTALPPAPSQKPAPERRPSLPSRLPSVPTPAPEVEPRKKPEPMDIAPRAEEFVKQARKRFVLDDENKRMEREAMGKMEEDQKMREREAMGKMEEDRKMREREAMKKMEEDRKMMEKKEQPKEEEDGAAMGQMEMVSRPRPMAANRGLLVNVAVAVVVLFGITFYVWHTLKNATGAFGHGHGGTGAGSYGDEM